MKNPRIVPKEFPFASGDAEAMLQAGVNLVRILQDIHDQLFSEGIEARAGKLYDIKTGKEVSSEELRARRKKRGVSN